MGRIDFLMVEKRETSEFGVWTEVMSDDGRSRVDLSVAFKTLIKDASRNQTRWRGEKERTRFDGPGSRGLVCSSA